MRRVYQRPFDGTAGGSNCAGGEVEGAVMDEAVDVMAADSDVRVVRPSPGLSLTTRRDITWRKAAEPVKDSTGYS